jgi:putative salt-induced outer membrane protein YdiY
MSKVNVTMKCGDVGLFGDSNCVFPFNLIEIEENNNQEAYSKFKEQVLAHYLQHKGNSSYSDLNDLKSDLDSSSSYDKFVGVMNSSKVSVLKN